MKTRLKNLLFLSKFWSKIAKTEIKFKKPRNWPCFAQWKQLPKTLDKKERALFAAFFILFAISSGFLLSNFYSRNTEIQPAKGGKFSEGVIGYPRFINPIYSAGSDVDRDLSELIFAGLMKYDREGEIIPDLAEKIELDEEKKIIEVDLRENIFWNDGKEITADDVLFTIAAIQNPDYKSPLRGNWLGVEMEKINNGKIRFKLKNPYPAFLERLTLKIMPKHIWQDISPQNFPLATHNHLYPVGSGPYKVKSMEQNDSGKIISLNLINSPFYFGKTPYISEISFYFFDNEETLLKWAEQNQKEPKGISFVSLKNLEFLKERKFKQYSFSWPRYFAAFFNQKKSKILSQKETRLALDYAVDKKIMEDKVFAGQGEIVDSPILPSIFKFNPPENSREFSQEKAEELLAKAGFEKKDGKLVKIINTDFKEFKSELKQGSRGEEVKSLQTCLAKDKDIYPEAEISGYFGPATKRAVIKFQEKFAEEILKPSELKQGTGAVGKATRTKLNQFCAPVPETLTLKLSLTTADDSTLKDIADFLKECWEKLGAEVNVEIHPISNLEQEIIKPRNYEILLFGEILGTIPDPFPFWHSAQRKDPGLNLTGYESKEADKLLEESRTTSDPETRKIKYEEFQNILIEEAPAVFLYSPNYIYFASDDIKGIKEGIITDPSKRFNSVQEWYIKTERKWK